MRQKLSPVHQLVYDMLTAGYSTKEIAIKMGYCRTTIIKIRKRLILKGFLEEPERQTDTKQYIKSWLDTHWPSPENHLYWETKNATLPRTDSKYRLVRSGEQGHLRTPYRPDGIFK